MCIGAAEDLLANLPLPPLDTTVACVRVAFGGMFLAKLYFTIDARELVWSHRRPTLGGREWPFHLALAGLVVSTVCFTVGFCTGPAALLQWALYLFLFRYASLFGLEDVSFHAISLYFVLAGAGAALSVDAWAGIHTWGRIPAGTVIPELALASAIGVIFLSAGFEKLPSRMWRSGLGAYYFFLLPHFRRWDTSWLTRRERLVRAINHLAIGMEIGLLPVMLINAVPAGVVVWCLAVGFTLLLATVFVLTWIGEALTAAMLIVLWLLLDTGSAGLGARWLGEVARLDGWLDRTVTIGLLASLLAGVWVAVLDIAAPHVASPAFATVHRMMRRFARYTWGLVPCQVFTEVHMEGPVVYRVHALLRCGEEVEVFRIFSPTCAPGPERWGRPTFFEVTSYKVAEACMELDQHGRIADEQRRRFILRLAEHIHRKAAKTLREQPFALRFSTLQLVPPACFAGACDGWYRQQPWIHAFRVTFDGAAAADIEPLARRTLRAPTGRNLARQSFEFSPVSK